MYINVKVSGGIFKDFGTDGKVGKVGGFNGWMGGRKGEGLESLADRDGYIRRSLS